jgi:hypothetical protein
LIYVTDVAMNWEPAIRSQWRDSAVAARLGYSGDAEDLRGRGEGVLRQLRFVA